MSNADCLFKGESSGACPSYFKLAIEEAKLDNTGYRSPGYHLSIHLTEYVEDVAMDDLGNLVDKNEDEVIIQWFNHYLPRCIALVPAGRRENFLKGFWEAIEKNEVF